MGWQRGLDIFTARITSFGQTPGSISLIRPLVASAEYEQNPVLVPLSGGRAGVFYEKYPAETPLRRLFFKMIPVPAARTRPAGR